MSRPCFLPLNLTPPVSSANASCALAAARSDMFRPGKPSPPPRRLPKWARLHGDEATTEPFFKNGSRPALRFRPRRTFGEWGNGPRHYSRRPFLGTRAPAPSVSFVRTKRPPRLHPESRTRFRLTRRSEPRAPAALAFYPLYVAKGIGSPVTDARENAEGVKWDDERHNDRPRVLHHRDGLTRRARVVRRTRDRDARAPPRVTPPHGGGGEPAFRGSLEPPPPRGAIRRRRVARGPRHGR